ncbi:hypothetical protein BH744_12690 [Enterococcus villorum]|nr:hypothetical protein BH744_12690 [Enterococcus villorum]
MVGGAEVKMVTLIFLSINIIQKKDMLLVKTVTGHLAMVSGKDQINGVNQVLVGLSLVETRPIITIVS